MQYVKHSPMGKTDWLRKHNGFHACFLRVGSWMEIAKSVCLPVRDDWIWTAIGGWGPPIRPPGLTLADAQDRLGSLVNPVPSPSQSPTVATELPESHDDDKGAGDDEEFVSSAEVMVATEVEAPPWLLDFAARQNHKVSMVMGRIDRLSTQVEEASVEAKETRGVALEVREKGDELYMEVGACCMT